MSNRREEGDGRWHADTCLLEGDPITQSSGLDDLDSADDEETCRICGQPLLGDHGDQPDPPVGPICGECYGAREFDQTLWEQEFLGDGM